MLFLLATASPPLAPPSKLQATASIVVERPATANSKAWEDSPKASRREVVIQDERGQQTIIRLIDYQ
jgi:hypothetical protein